MFGFKALAASRAILFRAATSVGGTGRLLSTSSVGNGPAVGFIGLGNMGAHMARNLAKNGCTLTVLDINTSVADAVASETNGKVATTPAEVAATSDYIITMLPANAHVTEVYNGENGVFQSVRPGTVMIDSSTIDATLAQSLAKQARDDYSCNMVDAPVSGGVGGAEAGTLTFMVGGSDDDFKKASEVLQFMGKNLVHCGRNGTGQVAKICNNMLLAITMIGTSEAMNLGVRMGMDKNVLAGILNTSTGRCWSSDTYNPCPGVFPNVPSSNNYKGGFGTALMAKDLGLAMDAASVSKTNTPLGSLSCNIYNIMATQEFRSRDFASVFKFLNGENLDEQEE
eukprot:m.134961 g.134961  ORF g.134961 m.134961 type:complete len:340 (+) comp9792_c0_seq1:74-1093(+)